MQTEIRYKAYILRLWQAGGPEQPGVFATLEDCQTNTRRAFATPEALCAFLSSLAEDKQPEQPGESPN